MSCDVSLVRCTDYEIDHIHAALDRLLAPHEQVFVDDLQMVKRLRLDSLHMVNADVDRVVDDRPDACPAPEARSAFGLDPFFIQVR